MKIGYRTKWVFIIVDDVLPDINICLIAGIPKQLWAPTRSKKVANVDTLRFFDLSPLFRPSNGTARRSHCINDLPVPAKQKTWLLAHILHCRINTYIRCSIISGAKPIEQLWKNIVRGAKPTEQLLKMLFTVRQIFANANMRLSDVGLHKKTTKPNLIQNYRITNSQFQRGWRYTQ